MPGNYFENELEWLTTLFELNERTASSRITQYVDRRKVVENMSDTSSKRNYHFSRDTFLCLLEYVQDFRSQFRHFLTEFVYAGFKGKFRRTFDQIIQAGRTLWRYLQGPMDTAKASDLGESSQQIWYKYEETNKARLTLQLIPFCPALRIKGNPDSGHDIAPDPKARVKLICDWTNEVTWIVSNTDWTWTCIGIHNTNNPSGQMKNILPLWRP